MYRRFLFSLALAFILIAFILGIQGEDELGLYFAADIVAFWVITLLFRFSSEVLAVLRPLNNILFVGFIITVVVVLVERL